MTSLSRFAVLAGFFLVSATVVPGQRFISGGFSSGFWSGYSGYGGYGDYGYSGGGDFGGWCFSGFSLHHPEEHAPFGVGFAHGDSDFQQSEYMDFDQAVALGKKLLAEEPAPKPSLGDVVRRLHLRPVVGPASTGTLMLLQDNNGRPFACRSSDKNCRDTV